MGGNTGEIQLGSERELHSRDNKKAGTTKKQGQQKSRDNKIANSKIILVQIYRFSLSMEMSRLTRDGTAETVSRDQILRHERGQGNTHFACSADHEQDWQPYPVDPYSCYMCDHTYIHVVPDYSSEVIEKQI